MAGIFGPVLVNYIREYKSTHGVPKAQAYNTTMYIMAGLLVIGFICNFFDQGRLSPLPYEAKTRPIAAVAQCGAIASRRARMRRTANMDRPLINRAP